MSATQSRSGADGAKSRRDQVPGPFGRRVGDRGALDLPADRAGQAVLAHQPLDRAPGHRDALPGSAVSHTFRAP